MRAPEALRHLFLAEAGGHRWQHVPPNEKRGRVHTSTVTVAILDQDSRPMPTIAAHEIREHVARGSGPGGQHRNKTDSCVTLTHIPTGISVRIDTRSQHESRRKALAILTQRVQEVGARQRDAARNTARRNQVGTGMRGDKIRTYRVRDGIVIDHVRDHKYPLTFFQDGHLPMEPSA